MGSDYSKDDFYQTSASAEWVAQQPKPITLEDLAAMVREVEATCPPLPKVDPKICGVCKEEMSEPAMPISGSHPLSWVCGYLCGRCAVVIKRTYHYEPRQRKLRDGLAACETLKEKA
jgi:hypothetical protein